MALQVWLPLNGNINNHGLLGELTKTVETFTYTNGALGKSLNLGGLKMTSEQTAKVLNNEEVSIAFWVYVNADIGNTTNRAMLFGNESMAANNNRKFSLLQYPTCNDLHYSWMNDAATTTYASGVITGVLSSYKWTHVAVVYKADSANFYINGILNKTVSCTSNSSSFEYETNIIHNSAYHMFSDFRLYDNAISPKEVKEISKGLICHYPLNDIYNTATVNKYSDSTAEGKCSHGNFTVTKLENERGYNYKLSYTGTGSDSWASFGFPTFNFTAGKTYDYSCKVRCNSANAALWFRASRCCNDWVTTMTNVSNADGKWHEYHLRQTVNATFDRSGTTMTSAPEIEFYTASLVAKDTVYTFDIDIKDVQVVEASTSIPFMDSQFSTETVYDTSEYGNHGAVYSGKYPIYSTSSPRYDGCCQFMGTQYITTPQSVKVTDEITVNLWAYMSAWSDYSSQRFVSCTEGGGWNLEPNGGYINFPLYANGAYRSCTSSKKWADLSSGWHMFTITYDGKTQKIYIDGVLDKELTSFTEKTPITYNASNTIFIGAEAGSSATAPVDSYFSGYISDFRMYATALSAADIAELYNVPISITDSGTLITKGEFKEEQ